MKAPLTLLFSTTDAPLSRVIRWMSNSEVSHCGFGVLIDGARFVADSAILGCEMVARDRWLKGRKLVHEFVVPEDHLPDLWRVLSPLGAGYDYSGMLGYLPIWIARWCGRKIRNPWASPTLNVCTEYVIRVMQHEENIVMWKALDPEALYPQDLVNLCRLLDYPKAT